MDSFAKNLSFKEIKTQLEDIKITYKGIGNTEGIERINTFMQQLHSSVLTNSDAFKKLINTTNESFGGSFATNLQNILLGVREPISDTEILANKLKELESQLRACGETAKANKIKEFIQQTKKETVGLENSMQELRKYIEDTFGTDTLKQFDKELKNIDKSTQKVGKKSNFSQNLKTTLGIGTVALGIRKVVGFFKEATTESVDYVETQNLFNVSMGKTVDQYGNLDKEASKYYTKAMVFQEKLSDKLKINIEESMEYQALFNAMSKSMGIGEEPSYKISENFTKLGYDLSSLYNIDPENAMQKLRAGLSGQTKPLRDLGLDITQQSLEPLLDELGIERSVKQLSQAEKMIARYIVVLRQASLAHGDFAQTIDSPANQLRIFNAQITAFKRNMGNLWQGLLGGILPYVNAIMMVVNELLKMIAKLFGFNVETQNISTGIGADDLVDDLGTATEKAKEFKKQLMGFDEINNITLPDNSSGISSSSVGGIDQKLLDAMKEYDNKMDDVKSKAHDIKDAIMKWLGFTGDTNKDMKILKGWLDKIKTIAKVILALYIGSKVLKLIGFIRTLKGVFAGIVAPTTSFQNGLALVGKGISNLKTYLKLGVEQFKIYRNAGDGVIKSLAKTGKEMYSLIPNTVKLAGGIAGLTGSSVLAYKSMEDLKNGTIGTGEALGKLTVGIGGATASGAIIGSVIPGVGTAFGALTGFIIGATSALLGFNNESEPSATKELNANLKEQATRIDEIKKSYDEAVTSINSKKEASLLDIEVVKEQSKQLEGLIDSNGRVKDGYQERVSIILNDLNEALGTEYKLTGDQITQNGELYKSYNDLKENINTYIAKRKEQIEAEAYEDIYKEKIKKRLELEEELKKATDIKTQAEQNYQEAQENTINKSNYWTKTAYELKEAAAKMTLDEAIKGQQSIQNELQKTQGELENYTQDWENHLKGVNNIVETNTQETVNIINNKKQPLREATSGLRATVKEELQKLNTVEDGKTIPRGLGRRY